MIEILTVSTLILLSLLYVTVLALEEARKYKYLFIKPWVVILFITDTAFIYVVYSILLRMLGYE